MICLPFDGSLDWTFDRLLDWNISLRI